MPCYVISYDLVRPGQDYEPLYEAIKSLGTWWHCLDSTWIVNTGQTAVSIRDSLSSKMDGNDKLLVAELAGRAAWIGFDDRCSDWLKNNL